MSDQLPAEESLVHAFGTCEVEVLPNVVAAATSLTLKARAACTMGCDLIGQAVLVAAESGEPVCELELTEFDGEFYASTPVEVRAPSLEGDFEWTGRLPVGAAADAVHEERCIPISFSVKPHSTLLTVWDVPSAVATGDAFDVKIGVKCTEGCSAGGRRFVIFDDEGTEVHSDAVGSAIWPGTDGLRYTEVSLVAAGQAGVHSWRVECSRDDSGIPHDDAVHAFRLQVVEPAECLVRVEVIDKEKREPIRGASVVMHPFRVLTDDHGVAEIRVPRGQYRLFVSGFQYFPFQSLVDVEEDVTATAELSWEPLVEHYDTIY